MTEPRTAAGKPAAIRAMRVLLDEYEHIVAASVPAENAGMAERVLDRMHDDLPLHAHALAEYLTLREDEARAEADKGLREALNEGDIAILMDEDDRFPNDTLRAMSPEAAGIIVRFLRAALEATPALPREAPQEKLAYERGYAKGRQDAVTLADARPITITENTGDRCLDCGKLASEPGVPAICAGWHDG